MAPSCVCPLLFAALLSPIMGHPQSSTSAPPLASTQLPNTTGIDGELTAKLGVDHFFSLWIVFNNDDVNMSERVSALQQYNCDYPLKAEDGVQALLYQNKKQETTEIEKPFRILAPLNNVSYQAPLEKLKSRPEAVKKLLLDHVVLGQRLDLDIGADLSFTTQGGRTVSVRNKKGQQLIANGAKVLSDKIDVNNGRLIVLDNYLFPEDLTGDHSFLQDMTEVLSFLQSGVRVFQHLLARSNVTKLLKQDEDYTVFVPTDRAFQRWHPIDWGFYPFSVPEFTEGILMNHFVHGNIRQEQIKDKMSVKTLGGGEIMFSKMRTGLKANGVEVVKGDTPVTRGNIMFLTEVLFVDDEVVHRLHESHRDKETPPLLAFPWFGAQFLSHAFLTLERDPRFTHITRFLNVADLAPHIPGAGYTFFVPTDKAFVKRGLQNSPDNLLSSKEGLDVLLSHFVKGRLYDKDIKDNTTLTALSNRTLHVHRKTANGTIEDADIIESEVFVYNLGTMFFINNVLFSDHIPEHTIGVTTVVSPNSELTEETGTFPDILLEDSTTTETQITTTLLP